VILVRTETTPDDIHGIVAAQGVLTSRGGMTSHAAVVARGMGKPCVCGCDSISIDYVNEEFKAGGITVKKGEVISIDGSTGNVILGKVKMIDPVLSEEFKELLCWADETRKLSVRTNADTPKDAEVARNFGAEGIGLCRTEHMFMDQQRLPYVQEMIIAETVEEREKALSVIQKFQEEDFEGIFRAMEGLPVTIRLLDPPLHEFLPKEEELVEEINELKQRGEKELLKKKQEVLKRVRSLKEFNPMLGLRGCRLGILYPEIYDMQIRAIFNAACRLAKKGIKVLPEVEIPLVSNVNELKKLTERVHEIAKRIMEEEGIKIEYKVGTMLELPRACLIADELAQYAEFFSFGTNDLTQTTYGLSRDDAEAKFLPYYINNKILNEDPFIVLDRDGVGALMKIAVEKGRKVNREILIGICGEHGGEPNSIEFCHEIG
ncbi:putative PEP-binding protein, partial [Thermovenabulum sp.]|uniref:putative PEP-binding protein n=1 Tax=Thermovenabulum sp. TaxID=3100335 RepID=UPI003C7A4BC6